MATGLISPQLEPRLGHLRIPAQTHQQASYPHSADSLVLRLPLLSSLTSGTRECETPSTGTAHLAAADDLRRRFSPRVIKQDFNAFESAAIFAMWLLVAACIFYVTAWPILRPICNVLRRLM